MQRYLLYANGPDRVGIVASVTKSLAELQCNLEDSRMTILHGQFSIMMVISVCPSSGDGAPASPAGDGQKYEDTNSKKLIENALAETAGHFGLYVSLVTLDDLSSAVPSQAVADASSGAVEYLCISVHGADKIGIVSSVVGQIADSGASVVDLATRLVDNAYVVVMTIALPEDASAADLEKNLVRVSSELGVSCNVSSASPDVL